jgi:predicted chitinase
MAGRTVYGNSFSSNGWPMVDTGSCTWVNVPGTSVTLQIQNGWPLAILRAFAADFNAYVEPLRDADSACWTATNSVSTSNHLSGTAMDLNWNSHPFEVPDAGFDSAKIAAVEAIQDFYEGTVFWGNDWSNPKDAMHFQLASLANGGDINTYNNPAVGDFIARKIRADGFSTFRRGAAPMTPPAAQVLADATGLSVDRAGVILPTVVSGLQASQCNNVKRVAMWLAQCGEESAGFSTTTEFASGAEYEGRCSDLGNCSPGDGVKYKGRTWIQITGKAHYQEFSEWAFGKGLCSSPTQFVDNPTSLGDLPWAGIGAAWYWTVSRPQINSLCDNGDILGVTKAINGGTNGLQDRTDRYNRALALGDQLLALTTDAPPVEGDDDLSAEAERMIKELYDEYRKEKEGPSRSFMVPDGNPVDSPLGFLWNIDGNVENINITLGYLFGTTLAEEFVNTVASTGVAPASWAGNVNQAWLQQYGQQWCLGLISFRAAIQKAFKATGAVQPTVVNNAVPQVVNATISPSDAQDIANRVSQQIAIPAAPVQTTVTYTDSGDEASNIADLYRSLKSLGLADALPIEGRAPLAALISILQTKNGTQV